MDNIINFGQANGQQEAVAEPTFNYTFRRKGLDETVTVSGIFTFNPIFAGVVDAENRLIYAVPMAELVDVSRSELAGAVN